MYVNERDQINYHGFLRALREMNKVSQEAVSKGICTVSGMNRFENGNRLAEKLMRDRLTARLGISGEKYEDYLQPKEYVRWEHRLRIVKAIEERELTKAKAELSEYEALTGLNGINKQFVEAMRFMILTIEGATEEELLACIQKAIKYTVGCAEKALAGQHLLADQEINLIVEQMRLTPPKNVVRNVNAWRISEYEKAIAYIDSSHWEKLQKAKVYPKIAFYICKLMQEGPLDDKTCRHGLDLCHNAIELLRDTSRLYYFIELTECRRSLAEHLVSYGISEEEKQELDEMLKDNNAWEKVFKELYEEYKVAPYMSDFCYLYYETECHDMVEVIETRRNMLDLSRVKLADGICTEKTIVRFEREGVNPSVDLVRLLFEKLGLCAEYRRARVITNDVEALMLSIEVTKNMNNREFDEWEKNLQRLENKLHMGIKHNKQEIERLHALLDYNRKAIDENMFSELIINAFQNTLPLFSIDDDNKNYFTRNEITCLFDLVTKTSGDMAEKSFKIINDKYGVAKTGESVSDICIYLLVTGGLVNYLGDIGQNEESCRLSHQVLKECLTYRRIGQMMNILYNIIWNYQHTKYRQEIDYTYIKRILNMCISISDVIKKNNRLAFFQNKLDEYK